MSTSIITSTSVLVSKTTMPLHITTALRSSIVVLSTLDVYESAVNSFLQFCSYHLLSGTTSHEVDYYLSQYMESLYQNSIPNGKQHAANTLFGIIRRCPQYKLCFPLSRQSLKGFQKLIQSVSHTPLTYYTCVAMAAVMSKSGYFHRAIALLLMFHCYLRVGEMESLLISDIALPEQNRFGSLEKLKLVGIKLFLLLIHIYIYCYNRLLTIVPQRRSYSIFLHLLLLVLFIKVYLV